MKYLLLLWLLILAIAADSQPGTSCDSAKVIMIPNYVMECSSKLDSGYVWQSSAGSWYKFTVPSGKGIKGMVIDMPYPITCSTYIGPYGIGVAVYKGSNCQTMTLEGDHFLFNFYGYNSSGWCYYNQPAIVDSVMDGETYFLNFSFGASPFSIRWISKVSDSSSCSNNDTLTTFPFTDCNMFTSVFENSGNYPLFNPAYYTIIPTSDTISIGVTNNSCLLPGDVLFANLYGDCNLYGPITSCQVYPNGPPQYLIYHNAVPGIPLILSIAPTYYCADVALCSNICSYTITGSGIVMPLKSINFNAAYNKILKKVLLKWTTETESTTSAFNIERSDDGIHFYAIGIVASKTRQKNYSFDDTKGVTGKIYYRLMLMDADGKTTYSNIAIVINNPDGFALVYPNPAHNLVNVVVNVKQKEMADAVLMNSEGKIVTIKNQHFALGNNTMQLNISGFQKGIYYCKIKMATTGNSLIQRIVIE